ncbi:hypothetical protein LXL04_029802 [Taraxacum kok-saghyz]
MKFSVMYGKPIKNIHDLKQLVDELRSDVIFNLSMTGGRLGSSLGVVELTVALHYVFLILMVADNNIVHSLTSTTTSSTTAKYSDCFSLPGNIRSAVVSFSINTAVVDHVGIGFVCRSSSSPYSRCLSSDSSSPGSMIVAAATSSISSTMETPMAAIFFSFFPTSNTTPFCTLVGLANWLELCMNISKLSNLFKHFRMFQLKTVSGIAQNT